MALDAYPNFRVDVFGDDPTKLKEVQNQMLGGPRGGGGGLPMPFRGKPSPTYPIGQQGVPQPPPSEQPPPEPPPNGPPPEVAGVFAGLTARDWMALASAVAGITGAVRGGNNQNLTPNTGTDDPQLKELLGIMQGRLKKSEPLHDSILSMANGLLPTQYQNGGRGNG